MLMQNPSLAASSNSLTWDIGLKEFAHPAIATRSALGAVLGPFVFAAVMFGFVAQVDATALQRG